MVHRSGHDIRRVVPGGYISRANVHSAGVLQSEGSGIDEPYSTEGYSRNGRWAKTALIIMAIMTNGRATLHRFFKAPPSRFEV